jgi:hypothetical protein
VKGREGRRGGEERKGRGGKRERKGGKGFPLTSLYHKLHPGHHSYYFVQTYFMKAAQIIMDEACLIIFSACQV